MRNRSFLSIALVLAVLAGANAYAQEAAPLGTPPGATQGLPFVNDGANQPVLQPLTPGAAPIEAPAMPEGGEHARKGLPQFDPSTFPRQIFWLTLTFVFAYVVFSRKTLPAIGGVLKTRAERISGDLARAQNQKAEVEEVRNAYEAAIAKAQGDAAKIINDLQGDLKKTVEQRDAEFKSRAEQAIEQLEMKITANRSRAMAELTSLAADLTVQITERLTGLKTDTQAARAAIDAQEDKAKAA
jgi:F-type H+-transporting ATPase subunit b